MRIAFVGLGIMGSRMAANLAKAGHELAVYNRTREKAQAWAAEHGGTVAATPREAAAGAEVVISMVVDGAQVQEVLLGPDGAANDDALFVDMSTIAPADARRIGERVARFMDAPVTGSSPKAEAGTLTIMAGGEAADFAIARPLFEVMGEVVLHVGPLGHGQMIKLINNAVAAANAVTLAQALAVGKATGVDLEALVSVMQAGSGGSTMLSLKARPMLEHDYATLFKLEHMLKDVRLCLEEAQAAGVPFPAASAARDLYAGAMGRGHADDDFAAVLETVEALAGVRL